MSESSARPSRSASPGGPPRGLVRPPAVAGLFYPADAEALRANVRALLDEALARRRPAPVPKALIAPHAGYRYSGALAASALAELAEAAGRIRRVVLLGPCHRVPLDGLATSSADAFQTPLGPVRVETDAVARLLGLPVVRRSDAAHAAEHSLEVLLPLLQELLESFHLVPLAVGDASPEEVDAVLESAWGGPETVVLVSSDLSHYHDVDTARRLDAATTRAIEERDPSGLGPGSACGRVPIRGLLLAARRHGLAARTLGLGTSADTGGPRDRVVGYGAYAFA